MMEKKISEQDDIIHSMQLGLQLATAQHETLLHTTNKDIRQHCVDKQDAIDEATKARQDLAFLKQKSANRIRSLERDVMGKAKEKMDMQSVLDDRIASIEEVERDLVKRRRTLGIEQDDLKKQQAVSELQVSSLAFQRAKSKTDRKKLMTSHSKALQVQQQARERDKMVSFCILYVWILLCRVDVSSRSF